ncbi:MAG: methionyl-tRNA formyltransferase [Deltaproteobacteria bacterium]|nr:methionyl-tRNA formyltransferase [Deltaproteobacteria bacterium]
MRTIFFGTPDISVPALEALAATTDLTAVVCQPDRPAGRGLELKPPPVKLAAERLGIPCVQPEKIRNRQFVDWVLEQRADVALVLAYGHILGPKLLAAPLCGCINLHASLLPRYRGAAPINWAIVGGESETGISLMQMDAGCDTGPVFGQRAIPIGPNETAGELYERLGVLAAEMVRDELPRALSGELTAEPQDEAAATEAPLLRKTDGAVDWTQPAGAVHDRVRGLTPWPGAHTTLKGKRLKLIETRLGASAGGDATPGRVIGIDEQGAEVACGSGTIRVPRAQLAGKKALPAMDLARGRAIAVGDELGTVD